MASCDSLEQEKLTQYSLLDGSLLNEPGLSPPHLPPPPAFSPDNESDVLVVPHSPDEVESTAMASMEPGSQCTFQVSPSGYTDVDMCNYQMFANT